ncbi:hypothetical protein CIK05_06075 [Bdellovibrio sp. qaytius]|nr:hypothetical protein CIK05_06075 [Bdellovibrio sp. qaytius]
MDTLNVTEKLLKSYAQINGLIDRYRNAETAALKKQDVKQIFELICTIIDDHQGKNKDLVKQFLFSYLRFLNKVSCTSIDLFRTHIELDNQITHLRNFIHDEINSLEKNPLGVCAGVVD